MYMYKIIADRCDIWTYVFVRTYKRCTMETIISNNIGRRVFGTYN